MKLLINNVHYLAWIALNRTNLFVHCFGKRAEDFFSRHMAIHLVELQIEPLGISRSCTNLRVKAIVRESDGGEAVCEVEITNLDASAGQVSCIVAEKAFRGSSDNVMEKVGNALAELLYSKFVAVPVGN